MESDDTLDTTYLDSSRREALIRVLTVGGLLFGSSTIGRASQDSRSTAGRAKLYGNNVYPEARFRVVSDDLDYKPDVEVQEGEAFLGALYWNGYGTRIIRYANTGERVLFFPATTVEKGRAYQISRIRSTNELPEQIVTVTFRPVKGADART